MLQNYGFSNKNRNFGLLMKVEGRLHLGNENKSRFILHFARFALPLQAESTVTVCRWCRTAREESPGSIGYPTSESGSYW